MARAMDIRRAASVAFHEIDCQQAVRAAATHGPRPHYNYETGQAVYFWRRGTDPARRSANSESCRYSIAYHAILQPPLGESGPREDPTGS